MFGHVNELIIGALGEFVGKDATAASQVLTEQLAPELVTVGGGDQPGGRRVNREVTRFVEALQRRAYTSLGRSLPDYSRFDFDSVIDKFARARFRSRGGQSWQTLEEIRNEYRELTQWRIASSPTHENPIMYGELQDFAAEIKAAANEWLGDPPSWPTIATLPSGEINAVTYQVPGSSGQYAIFSMKGC